MLVYEIILFIAFISKEMYVQYKSTSNITNLHKI